MIPKKTGELDAAIMQYIAKEVKDVMCAGMCDLDEYGEGNAWKAEVAIVFKNVEVKNNGR